MGWLVYDLSPTTRVGRERGRPRPIRLIAPASSDGTNAWESCRSPGVSSSTSGWPCPSTRRCSLVVNPPRLRPSAS